MINPYDTFFKNKKNYKKPPIILASICVYNLTHKFILTIHSKASHYREAGILSQSLRLREK